MYIYISARPLSDAVCLYVELQLTYGIGAGFRRGLFNPLRRILFKDLGETGAVIGSGDGTTGTGEVSAWGWNQPLSAMQVF